MNFGTSEEESTQEIHIPADINWEMLDKSKFFVLGAALFSGVSGALYPAVLMKTRQQVCRSQGSCIKGAFTLVRHEGLKGLYRGFGTSLMGTIPARALYMTALEVTKSNVGSAALSLGFTEAKASAAANAVGGNLVREGGWTACYRGLGPRCASMSMSATTMITTYEFLKRLSAKNHDGF
ncbi:hypothetical protein BRARA_G02345 [Brassica rapa]|uniref:Mitochondrial carrier protein n=1 Tax=Brassica campestris TaxID=3711 RepID=A0A397YT06_BRACM|nr:hypothetical protein BRARA_G02345 [Brassica rapa]